MGLFGGSKTYVSSTLYNLAGDEADRPDYLKSVVSGNIISNSRFSMSEALQSSYMKGPGLGARTFYRWAEKNFQDIGVPPLDLFISTPSSNAVIVPYLPVDVGQTATITKVDRGIGDVTYWAEQYILAHYPTRISEDWQIDWDGHTCTIIFVSDATTASFVPSSPTFNLTSNYLYVLYDAVNSVGTVVESRVWIYKIGSGHADLDAEISSSSKSSHFFPFIPIRHEGNFLSESYLPDVYALSKKAWKKASGQKLDDLIDKIADNENIGDVDYAYIVYGVPLNVIDNAARKYLFRFFTALIADTPGETTRTSIQVKSPGSAVTKLDMTISWSNITLNSGTGLKKSDAKVGEVWLTRAGEVISIHHQASNNSWETVVVSDLVHKNLVYNDKSVTILGSEALDDAEESGFLVPLHYETVREMSLIDSTQMMTASTFIVFNSYEVVKQKWYQTGIFKIFVFIAIIAISILIPPIGGAAVAVWASLGAAIGLSGLAAVIAGAIISQLLTMILMKILERVGAVVFGKKWAALFAAVASFAAMTVGTGLLNGESLSQIWGSMMSAPNLLKLTDATLGGVSSYVAASAQEVMQKTEKVLDDYNKESKYISDLFAQNIGYGSGWLNPMGLTDTQFGNFMETEDQFLLRTLLTGSDIAELSMDMLTNFSGYTLSTDLR